MKLKKQIIENIKNYPKKIKIAFPDGKDTRILETVEMLKEFPNVETILIDNEYIKTLNQQEIVDIFFKARKDKNSPEEFLKWSTIPNYVAMALLNSNKVDCVVGGATTTTADLLRPALQIVKSKFKLITSFFWMSKNDENYFLGDCAIIPNPSKDNLIEMTKLINNEVKNVFDLETKTALLSFSTNGSGGNTQETVLKVREAAQDLKALGFDVLGETQFDAAFDQQTRSLKWKTDNLSRPNVYIFPNLDSANIGYKIMKLTGDFQAVGPIIVGLNKPVNDLSRGANAKEIFITSIITMNSFIKGEK